MSRFAFSNFLVVVAMYHISWLLRIDSAISTPYQSAFLLTRSSLHHSVLVFVLDRPWLVPPNAGFVLVSLSFFHVGS